MQIGATETTSPGSSRRFKGDVDDLRIYNRALSTEEVMKLYQLVPESVNIDDTSDFGSLPGASKQIVRTNKMCIRDSYRCSGLFIIFSS